MNTFWSILYFNFYFSLEILGTMKDTHHNINSKKKFPFQNYYFVSTYIPWTNKSSSRGKRTANLDNCIDFHLKFSASDYKMCIQKYSILDSNIVNENTQFVVYRNNSEDVYKLYEINIKFARGYIVTKPYSSSFSGYIDNNRLYGKLEIDTKMYYIEPLDNYPFLTVTNRTRENAIVYEVTWNKNMKPTFYETLPTEKHFYVRSKRKINSNAKTGIKGQVCSLLILVDNSFLRIVSKNNIKVAVITLLHSLDLANAIFRITDFNNDGIPDNIGFMVKYIIVLQSENIRMNKLPRYTRQAIDGRLYLYFLSKYEVLREVCLGVAFTAQPFLYRALGLSYTAITQASNLTLPNSGGICERPGRMDFGENFNNLVLSYRLEHEETVPQITSDLSLAHELGHSFGSDHDEAEECFGYLMSPHTFNSTYDHNFMFSDCSKYQITKVLKQKSYCLEVNADPFCGNGLIEANEDCDCGYPFNCIQKDPCCIARNTKGPSCKVNKQAGYDCHPSQGLCCKSNCYYRDISHLGLNCKNFASACPCDSSNKNCRCGILGRCVEDECHSSECTRIGLKECSCSNHKNRRKCVTCCRGSDGKCYPSKFYTKKFISGNEKGIDVLRPYSVKDINTLDSTANRWYKEFCVDGKCVVLPFQRFSVGSFCLYKGELGRCQPNYKCVVATIMQSKLPDIQLKVKSFSNCIHEKQMCTILIYNLLINYIIKGFI